MAQTKPQKDETLEEYLKRECDYWKKAIGYCHLMCDEMRKMRIGKELVAKRKSDLEDDINNSWHTTKVDARKTHGDKVVDAILKKLGVLPKKKK